MKFQNKLFFLLALSSSLTFSQITKPSLSPKIKTEQHVGLAKITLEYGQPNAQGRTIFGSLIPYNKLWRTGANASTKLTTNREIYVSGNKVPAGTYGIYTIPTKKEWTIILHKKSNLWGAGGYNKENDFLRFKITPQTLKDNIETFTIHFENFNTNGADLVIAWENTKMKIPVFVDTDMLIFQEIDDKINKGTGKVNAQTYFDAAQFYYHKNTKLDQALNWFQKATELRPNAFWYEYYKGELAYKMKKYSIARNSATKCLKAAENSKSSDYGYIAKCSLLLKATEKH
ncbi:DUF2911 domain-containing protein [Tenacibaculum holothuriorum]|uniref:DUF2911 domain-containing protein n=1 Tax=Tenacibaculum holothuriorum TaxID=1635173 RepID=UPI000A31FF06|nr:DUF2911 domain-containing protein [Tenacibaculum holothuriorum]